ncbi:MAG: hypothetical protein J7M26_00620, partial [Armatimonadetes bacterium]|nr:hypothetical protein [Armatimonadota bacterium]
QVADCTLDEYVFFGSRLLGDRVSAVRPGPDSRRVTTDTLVVTIDPRRAVWSVEDRKGPAALRGVRPVLHLRGLPVDLSRYSVRYEEKAAAGHTLGDFRRITLTCSRPRELQVTYTLLVGTRTRDVVARVDFRNDTGRELVVQRGAPMVAADVTLGGRPGAWQVIADGHSNANPYQSVAVKEGRALQGWWYVAAKNLNTGASVVLGNLTNNKGLGRFLMPAPLPAKSGAGGQGTAGSIALVASSDYENIVMPPGAAITGEWTLLSFGDRGIDCLEHFGGLIARANGIDLMRDHPIKPYEASYVSIFNGWNSWGSSVIKGFPYGHDKSKYDLAFKDPEWRKECQRRLKALGLAHYGYAPLGPVRVYGLPTPLVRRYGRPDYWFKEAMTIARDHPEYYVQGRIDFSNPAVLAYERHRAEKAIGKLPRGALARYGWDFTSGWRKLDGQHDPFMTSAETYRAATGLWRQVAQEHGVRAYALVWMNLPGINYDRQDVVHIGADSDQGYYGRGLTFTQGLTRQISGRFFYNGRVWWNSPDSFHVYAGGLYSYRQAKVHASFCSIAGNLVHLGEPLADEDMPLDRLEILKRVAPTTPDVAEAVDLFEHSPARLWNMPVRRSFGQWNVVGLFNVDYGHTGEAITQEIRFADLGLDPAAEYLVYEFWSRKFLGSFKGGFTRTLQAPDCEVYSIVRRQDHPVLLSTNRHVRQMAYDVLALNWDAPTATLSGTSLVVGGDPYELRVWVPQGWALDAAQAQGLQVTTTRQGRLLRLQFTAEKDGAVKWQVRFSKG